MGKKNLYTDKVEIIVTTLIDIKHAFSALAKDKESFVHKVFSDDSVYRAMK